MSAKMVPLLKTEHTDYYLAVFEAPNPEWNDYILIRHWCWQKARPLRGFHCNPLGDVLSYSYGWGEGLHNPEDDEAHKMAIAYIQTHRNNDDQA